MAQRTHGLRAILSHPLIYELFQQIVGVRRYRSILARDIFALRPELRVLDIGCGPGDLLPYLGSVNYIGFDLSSEYIQRAQNQYGSRGTFRCEDVNSSSFADDRAPFDRIFALGLLHHLDDNEVDTLFAKAYELLAPGGFLVTVDPAYEDGQNPLARWLISKDRGMSVRSVRGYQALAEGHFKQVHAAARTDLLHIPYTHAVLVCTKPCDP